MMSKRNEHPEKCGVMSKVISHYLRNFIILANSGAGNKEEKAKRGLKTRPDTVRRGGQLALVSSYRRE